MIKNSKVGEWILGLCVIQGWISIWLALAILSRRLFISILVYRCLNVSMNNGLLKIFRKSIGQYFLRTQRILVMDSYGESFTFGT